MIPYLVFALRFSLFAAALFFQRKIKDSLNRGELFIYAILASVLIVAVSTLFELGLSSLAPSISL